MENEDKNKRDEPDENQAAKSVIDRIKERPMPKAGDSKPKSD